MKGLTNVFTENIGMVSFGLAGINLTKGCIDDDAGDNWILSFTVPQPFTRRGIWIDTSLWADNKIWYD